MKAALRDVLVGALVDLRELGTPHALVGGLAVSARVEPRMTRDVDVVVDVADDPAAERLVLALQARGYEVQAVVEQTGKGRLATARLAAPNAVKAGIVLDVLFASSGIEPDVVAGAESLEIVRGVSAPVASIGHLIALKLLSTSEHRPQDASDLVRLADAASDADLEIARAGVARIAARGFHRGRDLAAALAELLAARARRRGPGG